MSVFNSLCNDTETQNITNYVKARGKTYKLVIKTTPEDAIVLLNNINQKIGYYPESAIVDYVVKAEGYQTKNGTITMQAEEKTESIELEAIDKNRRSYKK